MLGFKEADALEVIVLSDNVIDSSSNFSRKDVLTPAQWVEEKGHHLGHLRASHGLSLLLRVHSENEWHTLLYDTGESSNVLAHNIATLGISINDVEGIVISHGHWDHTGGLLWALEEIGREETPVYIHPRGLLTRAVVKDGSIRKMEPIPDKEDIRAAGGKLELDIEPNVLAAGLLLLSGEIPRKTKYEKGFKNQRALVDDEWVDDELVLDDRALIANIKGKGLVIVTGCSHAGIVNIAYEARRLTGIDKIHAIIGGLHLIGQDGALRLPRTIDDLKLLAPEKIVPCHCTGSSSQRQIAHAFPDSYIGAGVGNLFKF